MSRRAGQRTVVFALGANLGDPMGALRVAARGLASRLENARVSRVYETPPEGNAPQPPYLNAVLAGEAELTPAEALALSQEMERGAGRARSFPGAPRTLDVDVLFVGDAVVDTPLLRVPHPRWRVRDFVVVPLLDVEPAWRDPESGSLVRDVARAEGWGPERFPTVAERGALLNPEEEG